MAGKGELTTQLDSESALGHLMEVAERCNVATMVGLSLAQRTLAIARATIELEKGFAQNKALEELLKALCGHEMGFGADKDYDDKTRRRAAIVALLKGARLSQLEGQPEWMILSGKCYLCKPFYWRCVRELEGITDLSVQTEPPDQTSTSTAWVPVTVTLRERGKLKRWEFRKTKGKDGEDIDKRVGVRVNAGMIVDAILGKAEAKALQRVYRDLCGQMLPGDSDEGPNSDLLLIEPEQSIEPWRDALEQAQSLQEVTQIVADWVTEIPEDKQADLEAAANAARKRVKGSRGERSKGG